MADNQRKYPVDYLIMHHAVSDDMVDWDDYKTQKWFSDVGRTRGYKNTSNSKHYFPGSNTMSYSQAHYCLHRYTKDGNKYGWRLTQLIDDVWNNVAWHCGNWSYNQRSIGIETAGNYSGAYLDEKALMLVADFWREHDKELNGKTFIKGHKDFQATACPGKIYEQLPNLIDMINNPDKWNEKLWPTSTPQPTPEPKPMTRQQDNLYRIIRGNYKDNGLFDGSEQLGAFANNPMATIENLKAEITKLEDQDKVTKAEYEESLATMKLRIEELEKSNAQGTGIDEETKEAVKETNSIVKGIWNFLTSIFK